MGRQYLIFNTENCGVQIPTRAHKTLEDNMNEENNIQETEVTIDFKDMIKFFIAVFLIFYVGGKATDFIKKY